MPNAKGYNKNLKPILPIAGADRIRKNATFTNETTFNEARKILHERIDRVPLVPDYEHTNEILRSIKRNAKSGIGLRVYRFLTGKTAAGQVLAEILQGLTGIRLDREVSRNVNRVRGILHDEAVEIENDFHEIRDILTKRQRVILRKIGYFTGLLAGAGALIGL